MENGFWHPSQVVGKFVGVMLYLNERLSRNSSVERTVPLRVFGMFDSQCPGVCDVLRFLANGGVRSVCIV